MKGSIYFCIVVLFSMVSSIGITKQSKIIDNDKIKIVNSYHKEKEKANILLTSYVKQQQQINYNLKVAKTNLQIVKSNTN